MTTAERREKIADAKQEFVVTGKKIPRYYRGHQVQIVFWREHTVEIIDSRGVQRRIPRRALTRKDGTPYDEAEGNVPAGTFADSELANAGHRELRHSNMAGYSRTNRRVLEEQRLSPLAKKWGQY